MLCAPRTTLACTSAAGACRHRMAGTCAVLTRAEANAQARAARPRGSSGEARRPRGRAGVSLPVFGGGYHGTHEAPEHSALGADEYTGDPSAEDDFGEHALVLYLLSGPRSCEGGFQEFAAAGGKRIRLRVNATVGTSPTLMPTTSRTGKHSRVCSRNIRQWRYDAVLASPSCS